MKELHKWKPYPLKSERYLIVIFIYYFLFTLILPRIAISLQMNEGITIVEGIVIKYQVLIYLFSLLPCIVILLPILKKERKLEFGRLFLSIVMVIGCGIVLNVIFNMIISWINGGYVDSENQDGLNVLAKQSKWLFLSMSLFLAPCLEELVFRGVIFRGLREKYSFWLPALFSSLLFGLVHVLTSILAGNLIDFIYLFLYSGLGFIFCIIYEYNRSIYACIIVHFLYNLYASLGIIFS